MLCRYRSSPAHRYYYHSRQRNSTASSRERSRKLLFCLDWDRRSHRNRVRRSQALAAMLHLLRTDHIVRQRPVDLHPAVLNIAGEPITQTIRY